MPDFISMDEWLKTSLEYYVQCETNGLEIVERQIERQPKFGDCYTDNSNLADLMTKKIMKANELLDLIEITIKPA